MHCTSSGQFINYQVLRVSMNYLGVHFEERDSVEGLLAHTDEVRAHPAVNHPLLSDHRQVAVHLRA